MNAPSPFTLLNRWVQEAPRPLPDGDRLKSLHAALFPGGTLLPPPPLVRTPETAVARADKLLLLHDRIGPPNRRGDAPLERRVGERVLRPQQLLLRPNGKAVAAAVLADLARSVTPDMLHLAKYFTREERRQFRRGLVESYRDLLKLWKVNEGHQKKHSEPGPSGKPWLYEPPSPSDCAEHRRKMHVRCDRLRATAEARFNASLEGLARRLTASYWALRTAELEGDGSATVSSGSSRRRRPLRVKPNQARDAFIVELRRQKHTFEDIAARCRELYDRTIDYNLVKQAYYRSDYYKALKEEERQSDPADEDGGEDSST